MAAKLSVVHLKIQHRPTGLTPPAVTTQERLLIESFSGRSLQHVFEENLLLPARQELAVA
jgi:hypothetical protein